MTVYVRNDTPLLTAPYPIMHESPYTLPNHLPIKVLTVFHFLRECEETKSQTNHSK